MCCVLGVLRSSFQATEHQGRLGHQPQASQVQCEFKFCLPALKKSLDVFVLGHIDEVKI